MAKETVIMDMDPGMGIPWADIDDNLALLLALFSGALEVKLVTVVAGNVGVEEGGRSLEVMLEVAQRRVDCACGAPAPLLRHFCSGKDLMRRQAEQRGIALAFDSLVERREPSMDRSGVCRIIRTLDTCSERITVIALGPLTNIALTMLQRPDLIGKIRRIVMMGGTISVPGNITPLSEFNMWTDPEAAGIVLAANVDKVLVPLDATTKVNVGEKEFFMHIGSQNRLGTFLCNSVKGRLEALRKLRSKEVLTLHDPVAVSYLLDPNIFTTKCMDVQIDMRTGKLSGSPSKQANTVVCLDLNAGKMKEMFFSTLSQGVNTTNR